MTEPISVPAAPSDRDTQVGQRTTRNLRRTIGAAFAVNLADGLTAVSVPWLATSITRSPLQIALIGVATRLPWLLFSLPAGVLTDRLDRRRTIFAMDAARFVVIGVFAMVVLAVQGDLPAPDALRDGLAAAPAHSALLLGLLYVTALLVGCAEVLRDNTAQTLLPSIVAPADLPRANGRMQAAETAANQFIGPPLAGFLIAIGIAVPFVVNAGAFLLAAALVASLTGSFRPLGGDSDGGDSGDGGGRRSWRAEAATGLRWLWGNDLLRSLAFALGALNLMSMMAMAVYVLYVQEVLHLDAGQFGLLVTGSAAGAIGTSLVVERILRVVPTRVALLSSVVGLGVGLGLIGLLSNGIAVWFVLAAIGALIVLWNVITVSLRQAIIPDRLLGRVNGVYRFFGWGTISLGGLLGAFVVTVAETAVDREQALRLPFLVAAAGHMVLALWCARHLSTERLAAITPAR